MPFSFGRRKKLTADEYQDLIEIRAIKVQHLINPILKTSGYPEIGAEGTLFQLSELFEACKNNPALQKNSTVQVAVGQLSALVADRFREDYPNFDDTPKDKNNQPNFLSKLLSIISSTLNRANNSDVLPNNQNVTGTPNNPDLGSFTSNQSVPAEGGGELNSSALTKAAQPSQDPNHEPRTNSTQNPRHDVPSTENSWGSQLMRRAAIAVAVVSIGGGAMYQYSQNQALQKQICDGFNTQIEVLKMLEGEGGSKGSPAVAAITNEIRGNLGISPEDAITAHVRGGLPGLETLTAIRMNDFGCSRG